MRIMLFMWVGK
jgi:neurotrimin